MRYRRRPDALADAHNAGAFTDVVFCRDRATMTCNRYQTVSANVVSYKCMPEGFCYRPLNVPRIEPSKSRSIVGPGLHASAIDGSHHNQFRTFGLTSVLH
jgi:hypothetical protein